jgi:TonB family protein
MEIGTLRSRFRYRPTPFQILLWGILFGSVGGFGGGCSGGKTVTLPEHPPKVLRPVQYDTVYANSAVDNPPEVRGGMEAVVEEMESPDGALQGVDGRVEVQFVVSSEGEATNVQVVQAGYPPYEREARRVILTLDFLPGQLEETTVPVRMTLPFAFHKRKTRVYGDP